MFEPKYPIRTERLVLRPYSAADVDALYSYHRLPEVARYLETEPRSRAEVQAVVTQRTSARVLTAEGQALCLVAELAGGGGIVGDCALLRLGLEGLGLHRIVARCDARNTASARVMERIGMRREAHFVRNEFLKGEWTDELIYAILRSEWAARQPPG